MRHRERKRGSLGADGEHGDVRAGAREQHLERTRLVTAERRRAQIVPLDEDRDAVYSPAFDSGFSDSQDDSRTRISKSRISGQQRAHALWVRAAGRVEQFVEIRMKDRIRPGALSAKL